ncbi:MAG: hypothetical protein AB7G13_28705 [Lautropia sp.]
MSIHEAQRAHYHRAMNALAGEAIKQRSSLESAGDDLDGAVRCFDEAIQQLERGIAGVLKPAAPEPIADKDRLAPMAIRSPAVERMEAAIGRINALTGRVAEIAERAS